jgi:hypothetical protein
MDFREPDIPIGDLDPWLADQVDDALALVTCWFDNDEERARIIFSILADQPGQLEKVTRVMAALFGMTMDRIGVRPGQVTGFSRNAD